MRNSRNLGLLALAIALPISACDNDESVELVLARFSATLVTVNPAQSVGTATAEIEVLDNRIRIDIAATGMDDVTHMQFIMAGTSCPTIANDTTGDGIIDIREAFAATGLFLLPLDGDLTTQDFVLTTFPTGINYEYSNSETVSAVNAGLHGPALLDFATLAAGELFDPTNHVVLIMGTADALPPSVQTALGLTANETLPVACGTLQSLP